MQMSLTALDIVDVWSWFKKKCYELDGWKT